VQRGNEIGKKCQHQQENLQHFGAKVYGENHRRQKMVEKGMEKSERLKVPVKIYLQESLKVPVNLISS